MTFLNVALLGGVGLIAVPIVLHLAMRRQPRPLEFPAIRFIQQRRDANRRRLRLRHLLLLVVRCAVIGLLALALARPTLQATNMLGDEEASVAAAMLIDTSPHMLYRNQDRTRLQEAQQTALWLLSQLPRESDVAAFDSRTATGAFSVDLSAARQRIERLESTSTPLGLAAVIANAVSLLAENSKARKELYIFSDLSRAAWSPATLQSLQRLLTGRPEIAVYLIDVGVAEPKNWSLASPKLSAEVLPNGQALRMRLDVSSLGAEGERTVELRIIDSGGQPVQRGQQVCKLSPGESQTLQFTVGALGEGAHQGFVKLGGEDGLSADDIRYFSVETRSAWRVLIVAPGARHVEPLFLAEALAPSSLRLSGGSAFRPEIAPLAKLSQTRLTDYTIVALLDPPPLDDAQWRQLSAYASAGGSVALFLGRNAAPIDRYQQTAALELLPGKLQRQFRAPADGVFLSPTSLQHPALARFRNLESVPWSESPVFRHWELANLASDASVVMSFSNDLPAIIERALAKGRIITFCTPFADRFSVDEGADTQNATTADREGPWNLLPADWPGVMLIEQLFTHMAGAANARLNYLAGDLAVLSVDREPPPNTLLVTSPRGEVLRQSVNQRRRAVEFAATDAPGNYRAQSGGEPAGIDLGFSVNLPPEACLLDRISPEELTNELAPAKLRVARNRDEIDRSVNLGRVGRELFPLLMLIVAALIAAESFLSNRFYPDTHSADDSQRAKKWAWRWRRLEASASASDKDTEVAVAP